MKYGMRFTAQGVANEQGQVPDLHTSEQTLDQYHPLYPLVDGFAGELRTVRITYADGSWVEWEGPLSQTE